MRLSTPVLASGLGGAAADAGGVGVQPDDERPDDVDVVALDPGHRCGQVPPLEQVEPFADLGEPLGRRRLEPDEDAPAPGSRGQRQQFLIVGEVDRGLRHPFLAEVRRRERPEQVLGARDVIGPGADQVVVHDQDPLLPNRPELAHDVRDGPLAVAGAVERGDAAERAVHRTAARRLDGAERVVAGQQVVPGRPNRVHVGEASVVPRLQAARGRVREHLRPDGVGLPGDDRIHVPRRLVDAHRRVDAPHDDRDAQAGETAPRFRRRAAPGR